MGTILTIASAVAKIGMTIASASAQSRATNAAIAASNAATQASWDAAAAAIAENERQAEEVRRMAMDDRSDRVREADKEFAALTVAAVEGGGLGTINLARLSQQVGAYEGRDLERLYRSEVNELGALMSASQAQQKRHQAYSAQQQFHRQQLKAEKRATMFGAIGSGLAIAGQTAAKITQARQAGSSG